MTTDMQRLNTLVHEQLLAEEEVARAEDSLSRAKKRLARYSEKSLDFYAEQCRITTLKQTIEKEKQNVTNL